MFNELQKKKQRKATNALILRTFSTVFIICDSKNILCNTSDLGGKKWVNVPVFGENNSFTVF